MKKCVIITNAYSRLESALNQSRRLKEEFSVLGVRADILPNDGFFCRAEEGGALSNCLEDYDFCVYLDKDKYVARMLEKCGMRLFNRASAIEVCDDKMLTAIALSGGDIPMPATLPGLLCYNPEEPVKPAVLDKVESALGYPVIVKASYGSLGSGVFMAGDRAALEELAEKLKCVPHLFQRFVAESSGRDVRAIVVGGEVVAAMERVSRSDFRSNIELGGSGRKYAADEKLSRLCSAVSNRLGLDYCGIDLLLSDGGYLVCEVNSNAFFGGIEGVTGVNVAAAYARHMCGCIYGDMSR